MIFDLAPVNDAPLLNADPVILAPEDDVLTIDMASIIANDVDVEGDSFAVTSVLDPENGTVSLLNGIATFTPRADYFGNAGFHYTVEDARGAVVTGFVAITLQPENDLPFVIADRLSGTEDTPLEIDPALLLANDIDPDGDPLTVVSVFRTYQTGPFDPVVEVPLEQLANGNFLFVPQADAFGEEYLSYRIADSYGATATGQITLDMAGTPDDPRPRDDNFSGTEDVAMTLLISELLSNDRDPDGTGLVLTGILNENGLSVVDDGAGRLLIIPDADRYGAARFDYEVTNGAGSTETATVEIYLQAVNDAPVIPDITLTGTEDESFSAALDPVQFTDADGDTVSVTVRAADGGALPGWLVFDPLTWTFSGEPPADLNGDVILEIVATDGTQDSVSTMTLRFAAVNDAPEVAAFTLAGGTEDTSYSATLDAALFTDSDGDALAISMRGAGGTALPGWLSFDADTLTLSGTPPQDFNGALALEVARL